jgi:hypothetical protein
MLDAGMGDVSQSHDAGAETTTTMIGADWLTIHCRLAIQWCMARSVHDECNRQKSSNCFPRPACRHQNTIAAVNNVLVEGVVR